MIQLSFLSASDQAVVNTKLAEIERKSGNSWACELTREQQVDNHGYLLEVTINGHFMRPVSLASDASAERICNELDRLHRTLS
jgi:hypothetical protein